MLGSLGFRGGVRVPQLHMLAWECRSDFVVPYPSYTCRPRNGTKVPNLHRITSSYPSLHICK